jgi:hypothetical protein
MTAEQLERLISALERFVTVSEKICRIQERRYPEPGETPDAEVFRVGEPHQEPQSKAEYAEFPGDGPGRFQTLIDKAKSKNP